LNIQEEKEKEEEEEALIATFQMTLENETNPSLLRLNLQQ